MSIELLSSVAVCYGQKFDFSQQRKMCTLFIYFLFHLVDFFFLLVMSVLKTNIVNDNVFTHTCVHLKLILFFRQSYTRHTLVEIFIIWWQCVAFYSRCKIRTRLTLIDVFESLNKRMRKKHTLIRFVLWNYPWNFNWWLLFGSSILNFSMKLNYSKWLGTLFLMFNDGLVFNCWIT